MRMSDWSSDVCSSDLQVVKRPPQFGRDGRRDIDELAIAVGLPEPAASGALELAHQAQRALLLAHRLSARSCRPALMTDILAHHHDQQPEEHAAGDRKSTRLELQSLMRISYAVFCLKKKNNKT